MKTGIEKVSTTLSVLPATKEQNVIFSSKYCEELCEGNVHPFDALKMRKNLELFLENIKPTLDELAREEAEKHGAKEFESNGLKIVLAENGTKFDYSNCNDPVLTDLQIQADNANQRLKDRQNFLKALKGPQTFPGGGTGNDYTVNPPVKSSTSGLRVSLL